MTITDDTKAPIAVPEGHELRHVDPRVLTDNPNNTRRATRNREGLAPSIAVLGILEPPLVRELDDGRLELIAGERRKYSSIKAGKATIPVFVRNDLSPVHQVAGMLVENRSREDLTAVEEAAALGQLAGFEGVTPKDIAAMTGMKPGEVRTALKIAGSEVATAVGERHDLTMDQLVVLAEFDEDHEAVKGLTVAAVKDPARFPHLVAQLRRERADRQAYEAVVAEITAAGVRVIELTSGEWLPDDAAWLEHLTPPKDRKTFTAAAHRSCPGHAAAIIETDEGYEAAYLCLDPVGSGHVEAEGSTSRPITETDTPKPRGMTDEQKAERSRVIKNNKAWEVATPVRREFVGQLLARRTAPKGTLRYVTEAILANPKGVAQGDGQMVARLAGYESDDGYWMRTGALALAVKATDARLPLVLLAQVAASVEVQSGERQGWRARTQALIAYLRLLESCGYGLSEVEQEVMGKEEVTEDSHPEAA